MFCAVAEYGVHSKVSVSVWLIVIEAKLRKSYDLSNLWCCYGLSDGSSGADGGSESLAEGERVIMSKFEGNEFATNHLHRPKIISLQLFVIKVASFDLFCNLVFGHSAVKRCMLYISIKASQLRWIPVEDSIEHDQKYSTTLTVSKGTSYYKQLTVPYSD
uniref:Uncharacterized protein n=1 Tax=Salix viminalis TaxID=40686 RepID=A0A6N2KX08_SALVM